jgi:hypothetical protein
MFMIVEKKNKDSVRKLRNCFCLIKAFYLLTVAKLLVECKSYNLCTFLSKKNYYNMPSLAWERHIGLSLWERPVNRWMRDAKMHHLYFKHFFSLSHFPLSLSLLTSSTILFPSSFSTPLFFLQLQIKTFIFFLTAIKTFI